MQSTTQAELRQDWNKLLHNVTLLKVLVLSQLRERYLGTWAGGIWAFAHPVILVALFWVVFAQGFKVSTVGERPFLLALICGIVAWMALSEAVIGATGAVVSRAYLVRKIAFPLEVLPMVHVFAALVIHVALLGLTWIICIWYGRPPGMHIAWLPFYMAALFLFAGGLGLLLSALAVAFRDVQQVLGVVMNIVFWATPIVWSGDMLPDAYMWLVHWSPFTYLIEGYRYAFIGVAAGEAAPMQALLFWGLTLFFWLLGGVVFRRLKPSFAEML
jgi:ABC-type polysaccharide/polyol phosphate export permease